MFEFGCERAIEFGLRRSIPTTFCLDLGKRPFARSDNLVVLNDVVRTALERPAPYRRPERHRLAIEHHLPVGRRERRDHRLATPAAAAVTGEAACRAQR